MTPLKSKIPRIRIFKIEEYDDQHEPYTLYEFKTKTQKIELGSSESLEEITAFLSRKIIVKKLTYYKVFIKGIEIKDFNPYKNYGDYAVKYDLKYLFKEPEELDDSEVDSTKYQSDASFWQYVNQAKLETKEVKNIQLETIIKLLTNINLTLLNKVGK